MILVRSCPPNKIAKDMDQCSLLTPEQMHLVDEKMKEEIEFSKKIEKDCQLVVTEQKAGILKNESEYHYYKMPLGLLPGTDDSYQFHTNAAKYILNAIPGATHGIIHLQRENENRMGDGSVRPFKCDFEVKTMISNLKNVLTI